MVIYNSDFKKVRSTKSSLRKVYLEVVHILYINLKPTLEKNIMEEVINWATAEFSSI